jgi:hypothetical protein
MGGFVRRAVDASGGAPADLILTGSRITLIFASLIVMGAAVFATFAINWRRKLKDGDVADA